jgi:hypothetical protein
MRYDANSFTVILEPTAQLSPESTYSVLVKGGGTDPRVKDLAGNALAADMTWTFTLPLQVISTTPLRGMPNASTGVAPKAVFSKPLDPATVSSSTVMLLDTVNNPVAADVSYSPGNFTVTITPQELLQAGQTYTVILKGGAAAPHISDSAGTPLSSDYTWSFTTAPLAPFPILVITGSGNKFTEYYQEILRAEGFNNFDALNLTQVTESALAQYDVAILGEMPLTPDQVTMLSNWVAAGGNLIAMRPDKKLASLLGISDASAIRSDAYLKVNTAQQPGAGIVNQTIQYHGAADLYTLAGATQVAALYSSPTQQMSNPAVTIRSVGAGQAAAFTFDLARSIVYTRQGNPEWAGQERDGHDDVIRPSDLFFPDWVNLEKVEIPQADELQRLLANMILHMNSDKRPLPRFWYFPNMKKAVILMTGDDHAADGQDPRPILRMLSAASEPTCSVENWECYRSTTWMYTDSVITPAEALEYHNQGFEFGVHVNTGCANWTPSTLDDFFEDDLASFAAKYLGLPAQKTNRTHCIAWSDWATHPKVELKHGIRLDENYYYWPPEWVQNRPGFMTGSGMPMRFADLDGSIIDVYQAATHLVNETNDSISSINSMLDRALGDEGYYGVFGTHYDYREVKFEELLLNAAKAKNVSLISARQLLTWLDGRNSSSFRNSSWTGTQLAFSITVGAGANNLFAMLPDQTAGKHITSLTINGATVDYTIQTIKGRSYAVFPAANGNAVATYAPAP